MTGYKRLGLLLMAALLLVCCACGKQAAEEKDAINLVDMTGVSVSLPKPGERIVVLAPGDCEMLFAMGAGAQLVGRGEYCDYPEEALALPSVQSGAETNVEQVLALAPDLVIMNYMNQTQEQAEQFRKAGVPVFFTTEDNIAEVYEGMAMLGTLSGHAAEAAALTEQMQAGFEKIAEQKPGEGKTVYFEVSPLEWGLWAAGSNTFMDEIAAVLGLTNIFADMDGWGEVSEEQVLLRNPDYIVTTAMYFGEGLRPEEEIMARPGWAHVAAVENGCVLNLGNNEIARPGPRLVEAAERIHAILAQ